MNASLDVIAMQSKSIYTKMKKSQCIVTIRRKSGGTIPAYETQKNQ